MVKRILVVLVFILITMDCNSHRIPGDWDCYEEMNTDMPIGDSTGCGIGVGLSNDPDTLIDSIVINVVLTHDNPSDLDILLFHGTDTLLLWDNNYPGGTQTISVDTLIGQKANVDWMFSFFDEVVNGKEGKLKQVTLMIKYK